MFTGLIAEVGEVAEFGRSNEIYRLTVTAPKVAQELTVGQSVAVSGVCLTAVNVANNRFSCDLLEETLARTSFSRLIPGSLVNLELPLKVGERLGGHYVQGHVDGVGTLLDLTMEPDADWILKIEVPTTLQKYVVEKGSISIEGISLTVASIFDNLITIAIIPHTHAVTNLKELKPRDSLNIEVDILAKYAEKFLRGNISLEQLVAQGF